ncbi:hypothetical protein LCGC14_0543510 [marine sediment metagenome]|uniref:Uncharacterized protein n=1 Tax=marine sediment metagenome TaxID=412755 RepID=A0A0F9SAC8_9ZZZZ
MKRIKKYKELFPLDLMWAWGSALLFIFVAIILLVSACSTGTEIPTLIYHGEIDRIEIPPQRGLLSSNAIVITPDSIVQIFAPIIEYYDGESITSITEYDPFDGDITSITHIKSGEYYLYRWQAGHYLLSVVEISRVDSSIR